MNIFINKTKHITAGKEEGMLINPTVQASGFAAAAEDTNNNTEAENTEANVTSTFMKDYNNNFNNSNKK